MTSEWGFAGGRRSFRSKNSLAAFSGKIGDIKSDIYSDVTFDLVNNFADWEHVHQLLMEPIDSHAIDAAIPKIRNYYIERA